MQRPEPTDPGEPAPVRRPVLARLRTARGGGGPAATSRRPPARTGAAALRRGIADVTLVVVVGLVDMAVWGGAHRDLTGGGRLPWWGLPTLTVALCCALLLRHRFPLTVWVATWLFTAINLAVPQYYPFAYLLVAVYTVARRAPSPAARLVLVASALPLTLFSYRSARSAAQHEVGGFLPAAAIWAIILAVAWGLGRLVYSREQHARAERERLVAAAEQALAEQRLQLARELHDSVSGAVAGMILHAAAARAMTTGADPRVGRALHVIEQAGAQAMTELHSMLGLLRSPGAAAPQHRFTEVDGLLDTAHRTGLRVRSEVTGRARPLPPEADLAAYRTVQESLTNATKHAGRDASVALGITWTDAALDLTVRSRGHGAPPAAAALSSGNGLRGLRERLDALGGELRYGPDGDDWCVHATLPATPDGLS
ncbi:sensor histidine kinase [Nocardia sp. BMG111209]|uniref:sensor histidine kinase n=1 Tax=Nocardia sp. BMG111209 TaxID=1160137 RepID=UPI0003602887|nr:histidine kinase [Nocardia sp. BMG111209]